MDIDWDVDHRLVVENVGQFPSIVRDSFLSDSALFMGEL